ncbi:MAG: pyridoxamine 5'-phosphate oxidase [Wigglesworthia glossinidia]|nr:pyridoxamine 5'-phosphate oxidase [Wigglesworthia glossinidia]
MNKKINKILLSRREYLKGKLRSFQLTYHPINLFKIWLKDAYEAKIPDFNMMSLGTIDKNHQSHQRIVSMKKIEKKKIIFFTNFSSKKALHIKYNSRVSLLFIWNNINRQILLLGTAKKISHDKSLKYFYTRPKLSQISIWASQQSRKISNRNILEHTFKTFQKKFENSIVPFPKFWGGYQVDIYTAEFWQGRRNRLHDRFLYEKIHSKWIVTRIAP